MRWSISADEYSSSKKCPQRLLSCLTGLWVLNRFVRVCDVQGTFPPDLSADDLREWIVLDTFDVYSPAHDHPQRLDTLAQLGEGV